MYEITRQQVYKAVIRASASHQRMARPGGACWCGQWPPQSYDIAFTDHFAEKALEALDKIVAEDESKLRPPPKHRREVP